MLTLEKITEMRKRIKINSDETASKQLENEAKELDESIKKEIKNSKSKVKQKDKTKQWKSFKRTSI